MVLASTTIFAAELGFDFEPPSSPALATSPECLGGNSIEKFGFGLNNRLEFHFDSMTCLIYQFLKISFEKDISSQKSM